jgi:hypothetical protein
MGRDQFPVGWVETQLSPAVALSKLGLDPAYLCDHGYKWWATMKVFSPGRLTI